MIRRLATWAALAAACLVASGCGSQLAALPPGDWPGTAVPILASPHLRLGQLHRPYNTVPPTSGPHWPDTIGPGIYREQLPPEIQVHVLEHGHVLLQYANGTPDGVIDEIERIGRRYPRDVVVAPNATLEPYARRGTPIALTAWARIERVRDADDHRIVNFIRAFSGRYDHGKWRDGQAG